MFPGSGALVSVRGAVSLRDDGGAGGWRESGVCGILDFSF